MRTSSTLAKLLVTASLSATIACTGTLLTSGAADAVAPKPVTATTAVNVRSGPATSYGVVGVATTKSTISATGATKGGWVEVSVNGRRGWIYGTYLRDSAPTASTPTSAPATNQPTSTASTPAPATTAPAASPDAPVTTTGSALVNVNRLYVRATSAADGEIVATVTRGKALGTTGVRTADRTQIVLNGRARWVFSAYTTPVGALAAATAPRAVSPQVTTQGISRLNANGKRVVDAVIAEFPAIRTIYGWRASSSYSSDHPNGRAVDIMIPHWSANADLGWSVAHYFEKNAAAHNVSYVIFRQKTWSAAYPERGWRPMADRGGATANHMDHVHVSVKA